MWLVDFIMMLIELPFWLLAKAVYLGYVLIAITAGAAVSLLFPGAHHGLAYQVLWSALWTYLTLVPVTWVVVATLRYQMQGDGFEGFWAMVRRRALAFLLIDISASIAWPIMWVMIHRHAAIHRRTWTDIVVNCVIFWIKEFSLLRHEMAYNYNAGRPRWWNPRATYRERIGAAVASATRNADA